MPRRRDESPTTTSYAVLGMLAIRPSSPYELANALSPTRGLGRLWPRAQSHLYAEPKRLVQLDLATVVETSTGRRRRSVYTITDKGRQALAEWLARPASPDPAITLESELMLKIFFADHGSRQALLASIDAFHRWARRDLEEHNAVARSYLLGDAPYPERAAVLGIGGTLLFEITAAVERWALWARSTVATWPEDPAQAPPPWTAFERIASHHPTPPR